MLTLTETETTESDPDLVLEMVAGLEGLESALYRAWALSEKGQFKLALEALEAAGSEVDSASPRHKGRFHGQRAFLNVKLGRRDSALIDYEAARFWAQEDGDEQCESRLRNNLAKQYSEQGRLSDALQESDAAIRIAKDRDDVALLGAFYDQRAQILLEHERFEEAIEFSQQAVTILSPLGIGPALNEARRTYGRALVLNGSRFLDGSDLETAQIRRSLGLTVSLTKSIIEEAMTRSTSIASAGKLLGVSHVAMLKQIQKFGVARRPERRRRKVTNPKNKKLM